MISTGGTTTLGLYDNKSDIQKLQQDLAYEVSRSTAIDLDLTAKVEAASGGKYGFITLAAAQAAQATLPANTIVEVTNDPTASNNGTYQWNGTTLTKSAYDPADIAKKADLEPLATKQGVFLAKPYYELDKKNSKLYVKLGASAGGVDAFYIRDSRFNAVMKTQQNIYDDITASAFSKVTLDKTSPLGVVGCICFESRSALYYDVSIARFIASDRTESGATNPNRIKIIEIDGNEITECTEKHNILDQYFYQSSANALQRSQSTMLYCDAKFTNASNVQNRNYGVNINTLTGRVEIPSGAAVMYTNTANRQPSTAIFYQTVKTELALIADIATWIVLDLKTQTLVALARTEVDNYVNPYVTLMIIRHSADKATIYHVNCAFQYSINDSLFGEEIYQDKITVYTPNNPTDVSFANVPNRYYPDLSHKNNTITFFADTVLRYRSYTKTITATTVLDLSAYGSLGCSVYYNLKTEALVLKTFNSNLTQYERQTLVNVCNIRKSAPFYMSSCDLGIPYTVDGLLYGMPKICDVARNQVQGVLGVAHRGYSNVAPENTASAYRLAKSNGFRAVETDVQVTSDGVFICHHDTTLTKVTSGLLNDKVSDHTWSELKDLDVGSWKSSEYSSERFLTLEQFCNLCFKLNLHAYIEITPIKAMTVAQCEQIVDIVKKSGVSHTYLSNNFGSIQNIANIDKGANVQWVSFDYTEAMIGYALKLKSSFNRVTFAVDQSTLTNKQKVDDLKALGLDVAAFTVNDEARAIELVNWGVSVISSDIVNVEDVI